MRNLLASFLRLVVLKTCRVLGKSFEHPLHARLKQAVMNGSMKMCHVNGLVCDA
jgi:hypothetical protein